MRAWPAISNTPYRLHAEMHLQLVKTHACCEQVQSRFAATCCGRMRMLAGAVHSALYHAVRCPPECSPFCWTTTITKPIKFIATHRIDQWMYCSSLTWDAFCDGMAVLRFAFLLLPVSCRVSGAGNSTSTCTALAPESPNDVDAVQTNVQWSTAADLSGSQVAVGYRQVYSQVRCLHKTWSILLYIIF